MKGLQMALQGQWGDVPKDVDVVDARDTAAVEASGAGGAGGEDGGGRQMKVTVNMVAGQEALARAARWRENRVAAARAAGGEGSSGVMSGGRPGQATANQRSTVA